MVYLMPSTIEAKPESKINDEQLLKAIGMKRPLALIRFGVTAVMKIRSTVLQMFNPW